MKKLSRERGMSAMELLLAISIILVMIGVLYVFLFRGAGYNARLSVTVENLTWMNDFLDKNYYQRYKEYPKSFDELFKMQLPVTSKENGKDVEKAVLFSPADLRKEKISSENGSNAYTTVATANELDGQGGWAYIVSEKRICVNVVRNLNEKEWPISKYPALKGNYPPDWGKIGSGQR